MIGLDNYCSSSEVIDSLIEHETDAVGIEGRNRKGLTRDNMEWT
jgi:hypothetical protein